MDNAAAKIVIKTRRRDAGRGAEKVDRVRRRFGC
jgi:hypothetical protein